MRKHWLDIYPAIIYLQICNVKGINEHLNEELRKEVKRIIDYDQKFNIFYN